MRSNYNLSLLALAGLISLPVTAAEPTEAKSPGPREIEKVYQMPQTKQFKKTPAENNVKALAPDFTNRKFGGALINSDDWYEMSITDVPYGLYEFSIGSHGINREKKWSAMTNDWMSGAMRDGVFYGIRNINMFGSLMGAVNIAIDTRSWQTLWEQMIETMSYSFLPSTMNYDFVTGNIYGIFYNHDLTGLNWVKFNTKSREPELISEFNGKFNVLAMATGGDGLVYLINDKGELYTVNRSNGRVCYVGDTGVNVAAYTQSMQWDPETNTFLWAAITPTGSALYSLDPQGPTSTLIKKFDNGEQICSIFSLEEPKAMKGAPEAPKDLAWNFSAPGALDGNVTLLAPSAGKISVWLDGEALKDEEDIKAGEKLTLNISDLSNAMHHVSAIVSNDKGYSPVAESFQFAGYDVPLPIDTVSFTENEGQAVLKWEAPTQGVENGYIDPKALYYKIERFPEGSVVAARHTSTEFTETLPLGVKRYVYRVTPFNGDGKQGESTTSNPLIYGDSYDVPYTDSFAMATDIEVYTQIDGDGDGYGWTYNSGLSQLGCSVTYDQNVTKSDNWIVTPDINLKPGRMYRITARTRNSWPGYPDRIAFGVCKAGEKTREGIRELCEAEVNTASMQYDDITSDFSVDSEGKYGIALGMVTPRGEGGSIFVSMLKVEEIGLLDAPAAAEGFTVTPDADRKNEATLAFTAPSKNLKGEALSGNLTANIYRDGQAIGFKADVTPGAQTTWLDNTSPVSGNHTYTVKMANSFGEGSDVSASAFIGVYTAPFHDPLTTPDAISYYSYRTLGFEDNPLDPEMKFASFDEASLEVDHINFSDDHHEMWIVSPLLNLEGETVYKVSFDQKSTIWGDNAALEVVIGDSNEAADLTEHGFDTEIPNSWQFVPSEGLIVITDNGGYKHLAFHITSPTQGYLYWYLRNLRIEAEGSALAPNVVTDLVAASELTSKLSFKAPAIDYAGRPLAELDKIEVFRNGSVLPVYTFENPTPGADLEWIDENALLGKNSYFIVPSNSHGRGNPVTVESFIGYDVPVSPAGIAIVPNTDNQTATITWESPKRGVNGGVLNESEMEFILVQVFPSETDPNNQVKILKSGIKDNSIVPERTATDNQETVYYGIATKTPEGVSEPSVYFTILGKPYAYPFAESFVNGEAATSLWLAGASQDLGFYSMPTSDTDLAYNGFEGSSQDGDQGVLMFLNGALDEDPRIWALLSPKVSLAGSKEPTLSFWLYKGNQSGKYQTVPALNVAASFDETEFIDLGTEKWTETSPTWSKVSYSLDRFKDEARPVFFQFTACTGGMNDIILLDNLRVDEPVAIDSVEADDSLVRVIAMPGGILTRGAFGKNVKVFTVSGTKVADFTGTDTILPLEPGVYVLTIGKHTYKAIVR